MTRVPGEDAGDVAEGGADMHPAPVDGEGADLLVVRRAAHLQHRESALHFAEQFHVTQQDDGVGDGGDVSLGHRLAAQQAVGGGGEESGDLLVFDEARQTDDELAEALDAADPLQGGEAVDRHPVGFERGDFPLDADQMVLQAGGLGVERNHLEQALAFITVEVTTPARGVAAQLIAAFLEGHQQRAFAVVDTAADELGGRQGFAAAGGPGDQDHRVAEEAAAAHGIQLHVAGRDAGVGGALIQFDGGQRDHHDPLIRHDGERVFAFLVDGPAELEDFDRAAALFTLKDVAQDHHVIGDEFLDSVAADFTVLAGALGGHHRGDAHAFQRRGEPEQFGADDHLILEAGEDRPQRVDRDAIRPGAPHRGLHPDHQGTQVEGAAHDHFVSGLGGGVDEGPFAGRLPVGYVPAQRGHVGADIRGGLLEGDEDPGLVVLANALGQELGGENRLGAAGGTRDQGGASGRDAAQADMVESFDAGRRLGDRRSLCGFSHGRAPPRLQETINLIQSILFPYSTDPR